MTAHRHALAAALGLASLATLSACGHREAKASLPEPGTAARAVKVARPATRLETGLARATGTIRARQEAVLAAKGSGQIKRIRVEVGDRVRAGQPLVEMDAAMASIAVENGRAAVRLAEANLAGAERELKRSAALAQEQALADATLDRVKTAHDLAAAQLDQARAGLKLAEQQLADTVIVAPFDGVVTGRFASAGNSVTSMPVTPIVALADVDHLEARVMAPEGVEPFVEPGQKVVGVTTPGGVRFGATVRVKNAVVDPATRAVEVLLDVARAEKGALRPGTIVNVDFGGFGEKDGLFVPSSAVVAEGEHRYVLVVAAGHAERRAIQAVQVNPGVVAVAGGLDAGAQVILDPGSLQQGVAVAPLAD